MQRLHTTLSQRITWYRRYHGWPHAIRFHWALLILYALGVLTGVLLNMSGYTSQRAHAATTAATITLTDTADFSGGTTSNTEVASGSVSLAAHDWGYRDVVTATSNASGPDVTEYQFYVDVDTATPIAAGKTENDCSDIRFSQENDDGTETALDYYIESGECDDSATSIWVKVADLDGSGGTRDIHMYYGNSSGVDADSDLAATFTYDSAHTLGYIVGSAMAGVDQSVISLIDSNSISDGTTTLSLDKHGTGTLSAANLSQGTGITAKGLFFAQYGGSAMPPVVPVAFAGTEFTLLEKNAGTTYVGIVSPWGSASVQVYQNGVQQYTGTVTSSGATTSFASAGNAAIRVTSDIPVLVAKWEDSGAALQHSLAGYPSFQGDLYGVSTRQYGVTTGASAVTGISWKYSPIEILGAPTDLVDQGSTDVGADTASTGNPPDPCTNSNCRHGLGPAVVVSSPNGKIGFFQSIDGDGQEMTQYLPWKELGTVFGSASTFEYIAIADPVDDGGQVTCTVYDSNGSAVSSGTAASDADIQKLALGNTSDAAVDFAGTGWSVECDQPVFALYEKTDGVTEDNEWESNIWSYKQMRQFVYPTPTTGAWSGEAAVAVEPYGTYETASDTIDLTWNGGWGDDTAGSTAFSSDVTVPANGAIHFYVRSATTTGGLSSASYVDLGSATSTGTFTATAAQLATVATGTSRYLQVRAIFTSSDAVADPAINTVTFHYLADQDVPVNPTATGKVSSTDSTALVDGDWSNSDAPVFTLAGASDADAGLSGYYVYFGTDDTATPTTAGTFQAGTTYIASLDENDSGDTFYLRVQAADSADNVFTSADTSDYTLFTYLYDGTTPTNPSFITVTPAGYANENDFTFVWPAGSDDESGIAGYYYVTGEAGAAETLTTENSASGIEAYQDGTNVFTVQAIDIAGNRASGTIAASYFFTLNAPSRPLNVVVDPETNTENRFTFFWDPPSSFSSPIAAYHYSVNAHPTASNVSTTTDTSVGPGAFATQQGTNTFYVVAEDEAGNVDYTAYGSVTFTAQTTAPGIPADVQIVDSSDRDTERYSLTLSWDAPEDVGSGIALYVVERATSASDETIVDNELVFEQIATTTTTAYIDTGLSTTTQYYYRLAAKDDAGATSATSTIVSHVPEGKYTTTPDILAGPDVVSAPYSATFIWETDRETSSFVEFGTTRTLGQEQGLASLVTDHEVTIEGLEEQTNYFYHVKSIDRDGNTVTSDTKTFTTTEAPYVVSALVSDVQLDSAIITWTTNAGTTTKIRYGTTDALGVSQEDTAGTISTSHTVILRNLKDDTEYSFALDGVDIAGNPVRSDIRTFRTLSYPRISSIMFENVAEGETVVKWKTNVPTNSTVQYVDQSGSARSQGNEALVTDHAILLFGLDDATVYTATIRSADQFGNETTSDTQRFTTLADTTPPLITNVKTESYATGFGEGSRVRIIVGWRTNEPATSIVDYAAGKLGDENEDEGNTEYVQDHVVVISSLDPARTYALQIVTTDEAGNIATSEQFTVLTSTSRQSFLQLVVANLEETFSWIGTLFGRLTGG